MNFMLKSTAAAAAVPIATASAAPTLDRQAIVARAEKMVALLCDRVVCDGWHEHFDHERAAAFLDAVRREKTTMARIRRRRLFTRGSKDPWPIVGLAL